MLLLSKTDPPPLKMCRIHANHGRKRQKKKKPQGASKIRTGNRSVHREVDAGREREGRQGNTGMGEAYDSSARDKDFASKLSAIRSSERF